MGKVGFVLLVSTFATVIYVYVLLHEHPVYEYHDVKVVKVIDTYTWMLAKDDGVFRANFCHDYDLSSGYDAVPGNIMKKFRYEDLGFCISIRRSDLGFWWERDPVTGRAVIKEN